MNKQCACIVAWVFLFAWGSAYVMSWRAAACGAVTWTCPDKNPPKPEPAVKTPIAFKVTA